MVKVYLLNVINYKDVILQKKPCIKRTDLTITPDALIYDVQEYEGITLLQNKLGSTLSYTLMGEYESVDEALDDYNNENEKYNKAYKLLGQMKKCEEDFTWNMLVIIDPNNKKPEVHYNYVVLQNIDIMSMHSYILFDACMIYESLKTIKTYVELCGNKTKLTKRETRILGYYLEVVTSITKPELYLTNLNEINYMSEMYEVWNIHKLAESLVVSINATITVFSFVFQYEATKKDKISSFMFSFLTLVVGFTTLYDFLDGSPKIRLAVIIIFSVWGALLLALGLYRLIIFIKEEINNYFKK